MTTTTKAATEARQYFHTFTRPGETETHWKAKSDAPEWITDLCRAAHTDSFGDLMFPDDHRYAFIVEALDLMEEWDDLDEARDSIEADIYTSDLTDWLGSHGCRTGYVDQVLEEFGPSSDIGQQMQAGQIAEKQEVFDTIRSFLEEREDG